MLCMTNEDLFLLISSKYHVNVNTDQAFERLYAERAAKPDYIVNFAERIYEGKYKSMCPGAIRDSHLAEPMHLSTFTFTYRCLFTMIFTIPITMDLFMT